MSEPSTPTMSSQRPYLLRALYEWIADNGMTPHVLVKASLPGVRVPPHAVKDGQVVLNIAERAVAGLQMGNDALRFSARFGGVPQAVVVPVDAVVAIYARETGMGMALPDDGPGTAPPAASTPPAAAPAEGDGGDDTPEPPRRGGHLRVVK